MELLEVIWPSALAVFIYVNIFYLLAMLGKNASIIDTAWGVGFILISTVQMQLVGMPSLLQFVVHILITLWGTRLALHIFSRSIGKKEDWRYANWRKEWGKSYPIRSYFQIFILQGLMMLLVATPIYVARLETAQSSLSTWVYVGSLIWAIGFLFETIGDYQLARYLKDNKTKGKIMRSGLWKYTRHPNYFGEIAQWWGLFIVVIGAPYWPLALISPVVISYLLLKVSGITMLEKRWDKNKEFQAYKKITSPIFPMPPKKQ